MSELGRRAKYYRLTTAGRKQLAVETRDWERMSIRDAIHQGIKICAESRATDEPAPEDSSPSPAEEEEDPPSDVEATEDAEAAG